jgi:hypothetical protein
MNRLYTALVAAAALLAQSAAHAQSLDAPESVCAGEGFEVRWTGPDGPRDRIDLAEPAAPADRAVSSRLTSEGNPAELRAPMAAGFYEVRYVQGEPGSVLVRRGISVVDCPVSGRAPAPERMAGVNKAVLVSGVQTHYGDVVHEQSPFGEFDGTIDALCGASDTIGWALNAIIDRIELSMTEAGSPITFDTVERLPGAPTRAGITEGLQVARDEVCSLEDKPPQVQPFAITYAYCRMAMVTPHQVMDIHLPPEIGTGTMSAADFLEGEAMQVTLRRSFDASAMVTGSGWSTKVDMHSPTPGGRRIGYPTTRYEFAYEGGLGGGGMVPFADMVSTRSTGTVWVSDAVPGLGIVRTFYENLTTEVPPDMAENSFFAGLLNNLVGMLRNGLPLEIEQTIESKVMGRTSMSGRSHSIVTDVRLVEFRPEWCGESLLPPDMPVRDIDQEMAEAMGGAGASSPEMAEAMKEYEEAMKNMTPEQRRMMEQMGMGNMMEQMMGGGAQGAPAAAAPPKRAPGGAGPALSEALRTDNTVETAQNYLQALGYDTGGASGEMNMETTIAISQFQAENGLDVTGEVSPQLLGVLAAEVDRL